MSYRPWLEVSVLRQMGGMPDEALGVLVERMARICPGPCDRMLSLPGLMADVGGRRVHVLCMAPGRPRSSYCKRSAGRCLTCWISVVILAREMRVCVYDRAGFGWSDPLPRGNRTFGGMAEELKRCLSAAGSAPSAMHDSGSPNCRR